MERTRITIEGNEAVATVAHALSEVIAIYPITPSTPMGEFAGRAVAMCADIRERSHRKRVHRAPAIKPAPGERRFDAPRRSTFGHFRSGPGMESRPDRVGFARAAGTGPVTAGLGCGKYRAARALLGGSDSSWIGLMLRLRWKDGAGKKRR